MDIPVKSSTAQAFIDAERCIAELQRGRAIALTEPSYGSQITSDACHIVQLVETLRESDLTALIAQHDCVLVLSRPRARALNLIVDNNAICLQLEADIPAQMIYNWAGLNPRSHTRSDGLVSLHPGGGSQATTPDLSTRKNRDPDKLQQAQAALNLAHHAHALPAFIMYVARTRPADMLSVSTQLATDYIDQSGKLMKLSSARIPLATAKSVELTVFRERHGSAEHVAITVGQPDFSATVTVRIHSSCLTGDILGSMKCDCGEQLQRAISSMAESDGGVVLYVSQEGRGIGLASKLLAYQLQDQGLDTIEANHHLGFESDERCYQAAVFMLDELGIDSVNLMTNNPLKIEALRQQGVRVQSRVPSPATVNAHNARYLKTKRERAGHMASCDTAG
ncbi:MAG: GTP cyclohydrolase II RibA [Granulosicoccus sp.]